MLTQREIGEGAGLRHQRQRPRWRRLTAGRGDGVYAGPEATTSVMGAGSIGDTCDSVLLTRGSMEEAVDRRRAPAAAADEREQQETADGSVRRCRGSGGAERRLEMQGTKRLAAGIEVRAEAGAVRTLLPGGEAPRYYSRE